MLYKTAEQIGDRRIPANYRKESALLNTGAIDSVFAIARLIFGLS